MLSDASFWFYTIIVVLVIFFAAGGGKSIDAIVDKATNKAADQNWLISLLKWYYKSPRWFQFSLWLIGTISIYVLYIILIT